MKNNIHIKNNNERKHREIERRQEKGKKLKEKKVLGKKRPEKKKRGRANKKKVNIFLPPYWILITLTPLQ